MVETALAELRARGIQVTAQRLAVVEAVHRMPHATADTIAAAVRKRLGSISRQAVYDALALLVATGLVRRIQPAGSPARFESRTGDNHHHLICRACGRVADVECVRGAAPCLTPSDGHGFRVEEAEIVYWGVCPTCQEAEKAVPSATVQPIFPAPHQPGEPPSPPLANGDGRKEHEP